MELIEKYLQEFKEQSDSWFSKQTWLEPRYNYFKEFFKKENLIKAEWKDFQEMGNNLHCFTTNPLAKANAFGRPNGTIESYRNSFYYLVWGNDDLAIRLNNLSDKKSTYKVKGVAISGLSELTGYAFPSEYVFFNSRSKKAINFLDLELPSNKNMLFGEEFISYNNAIKPIIESYKKLLETKLKQQFN